MNGKKTKYKQLSQWGASKEKIGFKIQAVFPDHYCCCLSQKGPKYKSTAHTSVMMLCDNVYCLISMV